MKGFAYGSLSVCFFLKKKYFTTLSAEIDLKMYSNYVKLPSTFIFFFIIIRIFFAWLYFDLI